MPEERYTSPEEDSKLLIITENYWKLLRLI